MDTRFRTWIPVILAALLIVVSAFGCGPGQLLGPT
jgi:hypothetical protein